MIISHFLGMGGWLVSPYFGIVILLAIASAFVALTILTSVLVGPGRYNRAKYDSYECGIEPTPSQSAAAGFGQVLHHRHALHRFRH